MSTHGDKETLDDIQSSLFTLLESQRKIEELIKCDSENEELRAVKIDVEIAIDDMKRRISSRKGMHKTWVSGDLCEVLWENDIWYKAIIVQSIQATADSWKVRLISYGYDTTVNSRRIRKQNVDLWKAGQPCEVLYGCSSLNELQRVHMIHESSSNQSLGKFMQANIDAVLKDEESAWVTFLAINSRKDFHNSDAAGKSRKVPLAFLEKAKQEKPKPQSSYRKSSDTIAKGLQKTSKRDQFVQKKEAVKKRAAESFSSWKKHFKKG